MKKIRLILFGAADEIINDISKFIKDDNCEIIAFGDNDKNKQGLMFNNLPILSATQIQNLEYDFVIIGAWYSYNFIKRDLLDAGIPNYKILPLLSMKSVMLLSEPIDIVPEEIIEKIFKECSKRINHKLLELNEITEGYIKVPSFNPLKQKINFNEYPLIAHAGGGILNNELLVYSNSIEAFSTAIEAGFKMFEFDVYGLIDGDLIFGHDSIRMDKAKYTNYTPLTFTKMLSLLSQYPDFRIILDLKYVTMQHYIDMLECMESILMREDSEWSYDIKDRLIMEVYDIETIEYAISHNWQCLLTNYRDGYWYQKTAYLCCKYELLGVLLNAPSVWKQTKYLKFFKNKNIPLLVQETSSINDYSKLKKLGFVSVMTNFLKPFRS